MLSITMATNTSRRILQNSIRNGFQKKSTTMRLSKGLTTKAASINNNKVIQYSILSAGIVTILTAAKVTNDTTFCEKSLGQEEAFMLGPTKEGSTGILFPHLCNGMQFVGCGVRVKYGFVKVYAVGTYMDPIAMAAVKTQGPKAISEALLNPMYPRTIRIVMNRNLSIDKYTAAIVEALQPRMKGEDLDKLDEFKKLNPPIDLVEGAEMEMTIRGNTMLYKNGIGGVGRIESEVFCKALCDVYYGDDAVSPGHKEQVVKGVATL